MRYNPRVPETEASLPTPAAPGRPSVAAVVAVVGAGPAGLMAAETLAAAGAQVEVFDAMRSVGRKFLLAGRGGLNLTHSEPEGSFRARYAQAETALTPALQAFGADALRAWAAGLGIETFVGTSGRVFPRDLKAAPLLRAWLRRLHAAGVVLHTRHRWTGWGPEGELLFDTPEGPRSRRPDATVLALGGASWQRLGSDGAWCPALSARGVPVAPLKPSNCGFDTAVPWSPFLRDRFSGQPVKPVVASFEGRRQQGEFVLTETGIEGSLVYAFSAALRDAIERDGQAVLVLDLLPAHSAERVGVEVTRPRGHRSLATHLKSRLGIEGLKLALLHEVLGPEAMQEPAHLAAALKALPITLAAPRPIDEAISTAGGVAFSGLDGRYMLNDLPGVFCAGEMLDWEAPTGGYLLTASLATGRAAGQGVLAWCAGR